MVKNYYNNVLNSINIMTNLAYYQNLEISQQEECVSHLPIVLGTVATSTEKDGKMVPIEYKRCLLCGKNLSYDNTNITEVTPFDATFYKSDIYPSRIDYDKKYYDAVITFKELCKVSKNEAQLFKLFRKILNNIEVEELNQNSRSITMKK